MAKAAGRLIGRLALAVSVTALLLTSGPSIAGESGAGRPSAKDRAEIGRIKAKVKSDLSRRGALKKRETVIQDCGDVTIGDDADKERRHRRAGGGDLTYVEDVVVICP